MDEQILAYSYKRILLSNKKQWTIDMYNMDGSQSGYALWKKPDQKDSIYVKLWKM